MSQDYPGGGAGSLVLPGATDEERCAELTKMIVFAHRNGFQCGIHAVGDRAITACVDGILAAGKTEPRDLRHYLIHCDLISDADVGRVAANDIGVSAQPILKWVFSDAVDEVLGIERAERQFPLRTLLDAGVHVSLSSDTPVTAPDWLQGVEAAVLRKSKASGTVRGPAERITAREAIRLYTMGGAWQDHMERHKGSLEPGKLADFCVLDRDILSVPPDEIHTLRNLGTVVGGRVVYDNGLRR
jgi:predicted amidohydrolase YtcJ